MTILLAFLSFDKSLFLVFLISELNSDLSTHYTHTRAQRFKEREVDVFL